MLMIPKNGLGRFEAVEVEIASELAGLFSPNCMECAGDLLKSSK